MLLGDVNVDLKDLEEIFDKIEKEEARSNF